MNEQRMPEATVARLPLYLQACVDAQEAGHATVSSAHIAQVTGVNSAKVRKDLTHLGTVGTRGVGYDVEELMAEISEILGLTEDRPVVIVGIGNLGRALASYGGFTDRGFTIAALLDADESKVGTQVGDREVESFDLLPEVVAGRGASIAVLATPARAAQGVTDALVEAGVTAILNFAPTHIEVPGHVTVRKVDLSTELQILSFYEQVGTSVDGRASDVG